MTNTAFDQFTALRHRAVMASALAERLPRSASKAKVTQGHSDRRCSSKCSNQADLHLTFIDPI